MPKKSSSGAPLKMEENQIAEQEKPTPKSKKPRNVIEEIFAEKKSKRENSEKQNKEADLKAKKMKKKNKSSSETPLKMQDKQINEQEEKPRPKIKKPRNEIEEIFAEKKRKKREEEEKAEKHKKEADSEAKKMKKKKRKNVEAKEGGFFDQSSGPKRKMGDGLVIYTEEELGIGKADAGGTPLCPFDCSCCF